MATAVKERPILFSADMVRAILDGRKTQTRRVVKPQPTSPPVMARWMSANPSLDGELIPFIDRAHCIWPSENIDEQTQSCPDHYAVCPYGMPGDRLWVREAFGDRADYAAIGKAMTNRFYYAADGKKSGWKYKPSIHMPRRASRITLEIEDVRVERLQDISEVDARAEGITVMPLQDASDPSAWWESAPGKNQGRSPEAAYKALWESINGPDSWAANQWVWAITFKRLEQSK